MTTRQTPGARVRKLSDLTPDPMNANRGTVRGREAVAHSIRAYGTGRAVLIDRHGRIVAGHKVAAAAKEHISRYKGIFVRIFRSCGMCLSNLSLFTSDN